MIRTLFQILTLVIFLFQMQNSVKKYLERPVVVQQTSSIALQDIKMPVIYVCQADQFNYNKARNYGYDYYTHFTMGKLTDSGNITWKGIYRNQTFKNLQEILFDFDYSTFDAKNANTGAFDEEKLVDSKSVYMAVYGFCMKLKEVRGWETIYSSKKSTVLMVDPGKDNIIRISEMDNSRVELGPTINNFSDFAVYGLEFSLHNSHIYNGLTCTDYERTGTTYGACIENVIKGKLLEWYGCLPPWFPTNTNFTCKEETDIQKPNTD